MTMRLALMIAATALVPAAASAAAQSPPSKAKAAAESCAHKFETTVEAVVDGKPRSTKVRLCGKQGQTDADWATTLKDAVAKVKANATMPQAMKDQITAALNAEVSKIEAANRVTTTLPVAVAGPAERPPEYSTLPPLPTVPKVATRVPGTAPAPAPKKPRITIKCVTPGQNSAGAPCFSLEKNTLLTIRADENLGAGNSLRFLRRGNLRGEVALAQMRQGQSLRSRLPAQLCSGVVRSDVEIQILARASGTNGAGQVVDTLGPYELRC
jgi:hypothetical protein